MIDPVRCSCGKRLGDRAGSTLFIRKMGLMLRGGVHSWTCDRCGNTNTIDLEVVVTRASTLDARALAVAQ